MLWPGSDVFEKVASLAGACRPARIQGKPKQGRPIAMSGMKTAVNGRRAKEPDNDAPLVDAGGPVLANVGSCLGIPPGLHSWMRIHQCGRGCVPLAGRETRSRSVVTIRVRRGKNNGRTQKSPGRTAQTWY